MLSIPPHLMQPPTHAVYLVPLFFSHFCKAYYYYYFASLTVVLIYVKARAHSLLLHLLPYNPKIGRRCIQVSELMVHFAIKTNSYLTKRFFYSANVNSTPFTPLLYFAHTRVPAHKRSFLFASLCARDPTFHYLLIHDWIISITVARGHTPPPQLSFFVLSPLKIAFERHSYLNLIYLCFTDNLYTLSVNEGWIKRKSAQEKLSERKK